MISHRVVIGGHWWSRVRGMPTPHLPEHRLHRRGVPRVVAVYVFEDVRAIGLRRVLARPVVASRGQLERDRPRGNGRAN